MHTAPIQPELPLQTNRVSPTFAEAIAAIPSWTDLDETRQRDLAARSPGRVSSRGGGAR